jgi:hypothetical protein
MTASVEGYPWVPPARTAQHSSPPQVCARNCYGQSALHIAARRGDLAPIELLLAANADANALDEQVGPSPPLAGRQDTCHGDCGLFASGRRPRCGRGGLQRTAGVMRRVRLAERVARCVLLAREHTNAHAHLRAAADPPRRSGAVHPRARRRAACAAHACPWPACGGALRPGASAVGSPRPTVARKPPGLAAITVLIPPQPRRFSVTFRRRCKCPNPRGRSCQVRYITDLT